MALGEDPKVARNELERAARTGFKHVNVMTAIADPPIYCEEWQPVWQLAEQTGIPVGLHPAVRISPPPARVPQTQGLSPELKQKILYDNARDLYGL